MTKLKSLLLAGTLLLAVGALLLLAYGSPPVDIKPGSYPNCMDLDSKGVLPVGLRSATVTNPNRITLIASSSDCSEDGGSGVKAVRCKVEDIPTLEGPNNLICQFSSDALRLAGLMPASGECTTLRVCKGTATKGGISWSLVGQDRLCEAHSPTCSGIAP